MTREERAKRARAYRRAQREALLEQVKRIERSKGVSEGYKLGYAMAIERVLAAAGEYFKRDKNTEAIAVREVWRQLFNAMPQAQTVNAKKD